MGTQCVFVLGLQASVGTIHASFGSFSGAREQVLANRGGVCFTFLFVLDGNYMSSNDSC